MSQPQTPRDKAWSEIAKIFVDFWLEMEQEQASQPANPPAGTDQATAPRPGPAKIKRVKQ
jgi:hypothetical protein